MSKRDKPAAARFTHAHETVNVGKLKNLADLHSAYRNYVQICIDAMVNARRCSVHNTEFQEFYPKSEVLSSQLQKCARKQASEIVETWAIGIYTRILKRTIRESEYTDNERVQLYCVGKFLLREPKIFKNGAVTQWALDTYWDLVFDTEISGKTPTVSVILPMRLDEMTCVFKPAESALFHGGWWIVVSSLENGVRIKLPLCATPYLTKNTALTKSASIYPRGGRWVVQFTERVDPISSDGTGGKIGIDVGLNVIAATSDGRTYGGNVKPEFDRLYRKVRDLRKNRQRQDLKDDSKHLHRLEIKLTGLVTTAIGNAVNRLMFDYPNYTFVHEDLDLRGCKGQKRFAYRKLHAVLGRKAVTEAVNPAYTSQMCPSCGYISRNNRSGTEFRCRSCGRISHADVVGGVNLLGRSEDNQITLNADPKSVKTILHKRFRMRRTSSARRVPTSTTVVPDAYCVPLAARTASNVAVG